MSGDCANCEEVNSGLQHSGYGGVSCVVGDEAAACAFAVENADRFGDFAQDLVIFGDRVSGAAENEFAECVERLAFAQNTFDG